MGSDGWRRDAAEGGGRLWSDRRQGAERTRQISFCARARSRAEPLDFRVGRPFRGEGRERRCSMAQDTVSAPSSATGRVAAGGLPAWEVADLPAPPAYSFRNGLRVAGAGAIILGLSIGSGEWLIG